MTCVGFAAWATYSKLDIVSVANGEVKPSSQVKKVQHFEGGIISEILIEDGDVVKSGQPLVILEATRRGADVDELRVRLTSLRIGMAREEAEAMVLDKLVVPGELARKNPELVKRAKTFSQTRLNRYRSEKMSQKELIIQRQQGVREIEVRIANTRNSLKLLNEQIKISDELMKDQLTNRYNHIQLLRERSDMRSRLGEDGEGLHGARAGFKEAKTRLEQLRHAFQERAREDLAKSRREFDELSQRIRKFEDSLKRTVVRAPVDGVVKEVLVSTVGGVLQPGDTVAELVPVGDRLIIEAELPIQDIGYVQVGQHAIIKLNSPDLVRFGKLDGTVVRISPDKLVRDDGQPYYRVRIDTERNYFERDNLRYELFPGTQVVASIQTGKRTVVEYLLDPFIASISEAMRER